MALPREIQDTGMPIGIVEGSTRILNAPRSATGKQDKSRADFKVAAYSAMSRAWTIVSDLAEGTMQIRARDRAYLPQEPAEDNGAYQSRLSRSVFFNCFRRTVQALVGMIFRKAPSLNEDVPPQIKQHLENVDLAGTHLSVFLRQVFTDAVRDGHAFMYVDMNTGLNESVETQGVEPTLADDASTNRRPYWVEYRACQAMNWRVELVDGQATLAQITFEEKTMEEDGAYGEREVVRYRVLRPGSWELFKVGPRKKLIPDGNGVTSLSYIPLSVVYSNQVAPLVSSPPLLELAYLNIKHYQLTSDLDNVVHLTCVPLLWARDRDTESQMMQIGAAIMIDLKGQYSELGYAEITGNGIDKAQTRIDKCERQMAVMGLEMLAEKDNTNQTATEINVNSAQSNSELSLMATSLQYAAECCLGFHAEYMELKGEKPGGSITLNVEYDRLVLSPEKIRVLKELVVDQILTPETLLNLLMRAGELPDDFNISEEIDRLYGKGASQKSDLERRADATTVLNPAETDPAADPAADKKDKTQSPDTER